MLKEIILTVGLMVGFSVLWVFYAKYSYRAAKPDHLGRVMIKPGPMSWLFGIACLLMFGFFLTGGFAALVEFFTEPEALDVSVGALLFVAFLGSLMIYTFGIGVYLIF